MTSGVPGTRTPREHSLQAILANQVDYGSFVASPDFPQYHYCWLRDGSFTAYALDRIGEHGAARRYHEWVVSAIGEGGVGLRIDQAIAKRDAGERLTTSEMPPARFSLSGQGIPDDDWPTFQIDGYGTWLWALGQHQILSGNAVFPERFWITIERTSRYLETFAFEPCFDVWEEHGEEIHTSTLASIHAGLEAASAVLGNRALHRRALEVRKYIFDKARAVGRFEKSNRQSDVDASLLWLTTPFDVVAADDPLLTATVAEIERVLLFDGGVRRYPSDTYFGGGAWPVLTCSLGLYYLRAGRLGEARTCLDWTERRIDSSGNLGEQYGGDIRDPAHYHDWVARWGHPATNLVWSHAMYLVLAAECGGPHAPASETQQMPHRRYRHEDPEFTGSAMSRGADGDTGNVRELQSQKVGEPDV